MLLEIPKKKFKSPYAEIVKGEILLKEVYRFEDLMYELTYALRKKRCIYCDKKLKNINATLDHRYPRSLGGISITNNLFPTCSECNSKKGDFIHEEYIRTLHMDKYSKKIYKKEMDKIHKRIVRKHGFFLPNEWFNTVPIQKIVYKKPKVFYRGKNYDKTKEFYQKNRKLPRPIIVDRNYCLLDGFNLMVFAIDLNLEFIPIIKLDNVVLMN